MSMRGEEWNLLPLALFVLGFAGEQLKRVRQDLDRPTVANPPHRQDCREGCRSQRPAPHAADPAAEDRELGALSSPVVRIFWGMPSISFEHTARVASGVTSRSAIPVPPVVTISCTYSASWISVASISSCSSAIARSSVTSNPCCRSTSAVAGPERFGTLAMCHRIANGNHCRLHHDFPSTAFRP